MIVSWPSDTRRLNIHRVPARARLVLLDLLETPENGEAFEKTLEDQMDDLKRVKIPFSQQ